MSDLIERYFREDLTEAEHKALSEELASSGEAAERFGALAEGVYARTGLPEPHWAGPGALQRVLKPGFGTGFWVGVLTATFLGGMVGWHFLGGREEALSEASQAIIAAPVARPESPVSRSKVKEVPSEAKTDGEQGAPYLPEEERVPLRTKASVPAAVPPVVARTERSSASRPAPVNLAAPSHRDYSNLSVEVVWPSRKELEVRVLDKGGSELVTLYRGALEPGRWVFDWDGKLADGRQAPAGEYGIEVRSGTMSRKKSIRVK